MAAGSAFDDVVALAVAHRITARYALLWDEERFDEWIALFVPEAQFDWREHILTGRDAIQKVIGRENPARPAGPGMHVFSNVMAEVRGDTIWASTNFQYLTHNQTGYSCLYAGRTFDVYVERDSQWQIQSRIVRFLGDVFPPVWAPTWPPLAMTD